MSIFNSIRVKKPKRTAFNLSHDVKLSCNMGSLIPIFCQPVIPGDTFKLNTEILMRFAPLQAPVMHRVNVYTHYFFVPNRLIWSNWKDFITGGEDGKSSPLYPRIMIGGDVEYGRYLKGLVEPGSLMDYLGFPTVDPTGLSDDSKPIQSSYLLDELPFRAYSLIWNEYYRDQNLQEEIDIRKDDDGLRPIISSGQLRICRDLMRLRNRAWSKDYFTSALPFPQRGEDVRLPIYGDADVIPDGNGLVYTTYQNGVDVVNGDLVQYYDSDNSSWKSITPEFTLNKEYELIPDKDDGSLRIAFRSPEDGTINYALSKKARIFKRGFGLDKRSLADGLKVDMSTASASTINELRRAMRAQEFLEVGARGGSRYIEQIFSYFGVRSSDSRLQRPEYLGGGKQPVVISDVLQTSQTTETSPQGTPAGNAASLGRTHSFKRFFEEHGYVIGIMSVLPVANYQQGLPRHFQKFDRYDYYWPQFAHLGEQEIKNSELYLDFNSGSDDYNNGTFGYTPRYAEYKYVPSSVHGDFKTSLKFWHMGRIFNDRPNLNSKFVTFDPKDGANRVFAVEDDNYNKLWVNIHHNLKAVRPMPKYGTPLL